MLDVTAADPLGADDDFADDDFADDLSRLVLEDNWGEESVDLLITQLALDATPTDERLERLALAGTLPATVTPLPRRAPAAATGTAA